MPETCKTCKCRDCIHQDDCLRCGEYCHDEMLASPIARTYRKITPTLHTPFCKDYARRA
jgi:hypothetical protein